MKIIELSTIYSKDQELRSEIKTEKVFNNHSLVVLETETDSTGYKIKQVAYHYLDSFLSRAEVTYNGELQLIKHFEYDDKKRKISEAWLTPDNKTMYDVNIDYQNKKMIIKEFDDKGNIILDQINELDDNWNIIKEHDLADNQITEHTYKNNKCVQTQIHIGQEKILIEDYYFDSNGNEIESRGVDLQYKEETVIKREFNSLNKVISEKQYLNGILEFDKEFIYDSENKLASAKVSSPEEIEVIKYEYLAE